MKGEIGRQDETTASHHNSFTTPANQIGLDFGERRRLFVQILLPLCADAGIGHHCTGVKQQQYIYYKPHINH